MADSLNQESSTSPFTYLFLEFLGSDQPTNSDSTERATPVLSNRLVNVEKRDACSQLDEERLKPLSGRSGK